MTHTASNWGMSDNSRIVCWTTTGLQISSSSSISDLGGMKHSLHFLQCIFPLNLFPNHEGVGCCQACQSSQPEAISWVKACTSFWWISDSLLHMETCVCTMSLHYFKYQSLWLLEGRLVLLIHNRWWSQATITVITWCNTYVTYCIY